MIEEGRKEQAKVFLQEALKLDPFNPDLFVIHLFLKNRSVTTFNPSLETKKKVYLWFISTIL